MSVCSRAPRLLVAVVVLLCSAWTVGSAAARDCGSAAATAEDLTAVFDGGIPGLAGADYQRTVALRDGRVLWLLQDAYVARPGGRSPRLVHNVGVLQEGRCFSLLRGGTDSRPRSWLAADLTDRYDRWFWPLGGTTARDGTVRVFLAEMREPGARYLSHAAPLATWMATIDPSTLAVTSLRPAPDPSPALFGWAVASDRRFTYLFSHCYRQFGFGMLGHDECAGEIRVARVRRGSLDSEPRYWNGQRWVRDAGEAVNVAPQVGPGGERRVINPMQFAYVEGRWIAVTKEGDWWGSTIYLDRAARPTGPWTTADHLPAQPLGDPDVFNTYFASVVAIGTHHVVIGLSNNRWDGELAGAYRPTFSAVPLQRWDRDVR